MSWMSAWGAGVPPHLPSWAFMEMLINHGVTETSVSWPPVRQVSLFSQVILFMFAFVPKGTWGHLQQAHLYKRALKDSAWGNLPWNEAGLFLIWASHLALDFLRVKTKWEAREGVWYFLPESFQFVSIYSWYRMQRPISYVDSNTRGPAWQNGPL